MFYSRVGQLRFSDQMNTLLENNHHCRRLPTYSKHWKIYTPAWFYKHFCCNLNMLINQKILLNFISVRDFFLKLWQKWYFLKQKIEVSKMDYHETIPMAGFHSDNGQHLVSLEIISLFPMAKNGWFDCS